MMTEDASEEEEEELPQKNPPTPCLWQAPASARKTKRKTRPDIRRSARWRATKEGRPALGLQLEGRGAGAGQRRCLRLAQSGQSPHVACGLSPQEEVGLRRELGWTTPTRNGDVQKVMTTDVQAQWRHFSLEPLCCTVSYRYVSDQLYLGRLPAGRGVRSWHWIISRHGARSPASGKNSNLDLGLKLRCASLMHRRNRSKRSISRK